MEDEPETLLPRFSVHSHMFPPTTDLLFLGKWNLRQTVEYIKDYLKGRKGQTSFYGQLPL